MALTRAQTRAPIQSNTSLQHSIVQSRAGRCANGNTKKKHLAGPCLPPKPSLEPQTRVVSISQKRQREDQDASEQPGRRALKRARPSNRTPQSRNNGETGADHMRVPTGVILLPVDVAPMPREPLSMLPVLRQPFPQETWRH